ncbi:MAG TPA: nitrite/sulfite reductase, partial [Variovorax sp.]|nr:nitrite/sulfite reductase [Variovorax sp.]
DRVAASFVPPALANRTYQPLEQTEAELKAQSEDDTLFARWLQRNVAPHKNPQLRAVTLSFKRRLQAPGDASGSQLDTAALLADRFSAGEARVTHDQNLLLPWVHAEDLHALWLAAREAGLASTNVHLLTDMIACPGGDFCALANARSIPIAEAITERYQDLDELDDIGEIDLHISGCINSCGHHHSGHIGILGVDKDGKEWYQVTLGGSDGSDLSGPAVAGKVVGPSFSAAEVPDVIEAVLGTYRDTREIVDGKRENFIDTLRRVGIDPFKTAANGARFAKAEEVAA